MEQFAYGTNRALITDEIETIADIVELDNYLTPMAENKREEDEICNKLKYHSEPIEIKHYGHIQTLEAIERDATYPEYIKSLVNYILYAYNSHKPLLINMNVVNNAILDVLTVMVEQKSEELRSKFVDHAGKKQLWILDSEKDIISAYLCQIKGDSNHRVINELFDIINNFSLPTTTECDKKCYQLSLLTMFGNYYSYFMTCCGIPGLLFTDDRESILKSKNLIKTLLDYLDVQDCEVKTWQNSVYNFYDELLNVYDGHPTVDYWNAIISRSGNGSGRPTRIDGNASIFCTNTFKRSMPYDKRPKCDITYYDTVYSVTKNYKCVKYPTYDGKEYYGMITGIQTTSKPLVKSSPF